MGKIGRRGFALLMIAAWIALVGGAAPVNVRAESAPVTLYSPGAAGVAEVRIGRETSTVHPPVSFDRGARPIHPISAGAASPVAPPVAAAHPEGVATLVHNFNGVSSRDSAKTNFGLEFEPPDQGLCEGNGYVLEAVNSAYTVYRPDGNALVGPFNVNDLFNEGAQEFTSDPRCFYDPTTKTWFASILFINSSSTASHLDLAVNSSGDPRTLWTVYQFDTTDLGGNGCPCFGDQPLLGIDQYNVYISTNEYSILGTQANGAQIYAISKADLVAGNPSHFVHFGNLTIGGTMAFSVQPALSTGTPEAEYFLSSLDPNGTFDNRIGAWAMTDRGAVGVGASPVLSSEVIGSEVYGVPPKAAQKGSASVLDSGDDRMQQVQFISGNLWGALTTAVTIPGDPMERAAAAWFDVHPSLNGDQIGNVTIANQGYEAQSGNYVIYPAIQADASGKAAMVFTLTGSGRYPSAAYAVRTSDTTAFGAPKVAAAGIGPYDPTATRWGDYSFAVLDPASGIFWMATEYMPPRPSQTQNGRRNWGTRVVAVTIN